MSKLSSAEMFEWANEPPEWQITSHAASEADCVELREFAVGERRRFLLEACLAEIALRQGVDEQAPVEIEVSRELDFSTIPLKLFVGYEECGELADSFSDEDKRWYNRYQAKCKWNDQARVFNGIAGYDLLHAKNTDVAYVSEDAYDSALEYSEYLSGLGLKPKLLMGGLIYVKHAVLDLGIVEEDTAAFYNLGWDTHKPVFTPARFWHAIVEAKRTFNESNDLHTYADVVQEVGDGLFFAPYIDDAVVASGEYVSLDTVLSICAREGISRSLAATIFSRMLDALDDEKLLRQTMNGKWYRYQQSYYSSVSRRPGVAFFDKNRLPDIWDAFQEGNASIHKSVIDRIMLALGHEIPDDPDDAAVYDYLVFGE